MFFFKQKTAYEMRISDWSSDVCSSDLKRTIMTTAMLITMIACFAISVSIAVSIGLASVVGIVVAEANMLVAVKEIFNSINKFPLAAIPFFILAGNMMEAGGISQRLVEFATSLVGGVKGGLSDTCVLTCMIFAAVSGSSVATTFAIGALPLGIASFRASG